MEQELKEFAEKVKLLIRLEFLGETRYELRREVYALSHKYSRGSANEKD